MEHAVPATLAGKRLDACVKQLFSLSWNEARRAIETGKICVDDVRATDGAAILREGQRLVLDAKARRPERSDALRDEQVVYVDDALIVVDKPAGIATVPYGDEAQDALDARVRRHLSRGKHRPELGVVHRIDKETSGLVVFTRTWAAKRALAEQFRVHSVHRLYQALVHGTPKSGRIESSLVTDRGDGLRGSGPGGQRAVTFVEVEEVFAAASLVRCRLETGRTHQIRIHLSEAGCPLLGERVYVRDFPAALIPAPRLMLHASELGFVHPSGKALRFARPPPPDMQALLQELRDRR